MKRQYIILIIISLLITNYKFLAQTSSKGTPPSIIFELKNDGIANVNMPDFNIEAMLLEDEINNETKATAFRFAKAFQLDINPQNSGTWEILPNGDKLWRLSIKSDNAYSLNLIFDEYELPENAALYLYNEDKSFILGAFTNLNNKESKVLPTALVPGDKIFIEYYEPANVKFNGKLHIGQIGHDYRGIFNFEKDGSFGQSGTCNVDINCPDGDAWQVDKHAVCRIIMGGVSLCTGALINNTNNDETPYFLTAHHCTGEAYNTWVFYFNYESPTCNGVDGSISQTVSGCQLRATTSASDAQNLDFCLVELSSTPESAYNPYYAGWNKGTAAASNTIGIHHPSGDVKKISKDNDAPVTGDYGSFGDNAHWQVLEWDLGTTEGGSSGSPLFDENHRIIGDLTGGQASCANSINDYYAKFTISWDYYSTSAKQLKSWLDPAGSNPTTLDGYDPNGGAIVACDFINNFANDPLTYYDFSTSKWGYWTGHNEYAWTKFADKYTNTTYHYVHGINIPCAVAEDNSGSSFITFKVWEGGTQPGAELESVSVLISDFIVDSWNYLAFDPPILTDGNFYVGYEILYNTPHDNFAIYQAHDRYTGVNSSYIYDGSWKSYSSLGLATSLGLDVRTCVSELSDGTITKISPMNVSHPKTNNPKFVSNEINVYPNPVNNIIYVNLGNAELKNANIKIYDIFGKVIFQQDFNTYSQKVELNLTSLKSGMYFVHINNGTEKEIRKISIIK